MKLSDEPAKMSPEWLRKPRGERELIIFVARTFGPLIADALEIADEAAVGFIECECHIVTLDGYDWADLTDTSDTDLSEDARQRIKASLEQSVRYLDARGMLLRHSPERPNLVRFVERS